VIVRTSARPPGRPCADAERSFSSSAPSTFAAAGLLFDGIPGRAGFPNQGPARPGATVPRDKRGKAERRWRTGSFSCLWATATGDRMTPVPGPIPRASRELVESRWRAGRFICWATRAGERCENPPALRPCLRALSGGEGPLTRTGGFSYAGTPTKFQHMTCGTSDMGGQRLVGRLPPTRRFGRMEHFRFLGPQISLDDTPESESR